MKQPNEKASVANGAPTHAKSSARISEKASVGGFQWSGKTPTYLGAPTMIPSSPIFRCTHPRFCRQGNDKNILPVSNLGGVLPRLPGRPVCQSEVEIASLASRSSGSPLPRCWLDSCGYHSLSRHFRCGSRLDSTMFVCLVRMWRHILPSVPLDRHSRFSSIHGARFSV